MDDKQLEKLGEELGTKIEEDELDGEEEQDEVKNLPNPEDKSVYNQELRSVISHKQYALL